MLENAKASAMHLLNRQSRPEEFASVAAFLASDDASFMTGSDVLVDGGYTAK
jgi:dihydroanticapsin dehydrogenase